MSSIPDELKYTKEHEWVRLENDRAVVGITDHAQTELTDVVYVELPAVGSEFSEGEEFAIIESVKAASEIYAPIGGVVAEVNAELEDKPELINEDPYGKGWIVVLEVKDKADIDKLMTSEQYRELIEE
ncbi:MAG: glycine cleavage system protein GcvH [Thermoplasmata archaeon]